MKMLLTLSYLIPSSMSESDAKIIHAEGLINFEFDNNITFSRSEFIWRKYKDQINYRIFYRIVEMFKC